LKGINMFGNNRTFYATYKNVSGLVPASPVFVKGVKVGQVAAISFDTKKDVVVVELTIDYPSLQIPKDSKALFSSADFFTKSIDIVVGDSMVYYKVGDTIESEKPLSLQENVNAELLPLKQKTQQLIGSIDSMVSIISGVMGRNTDELDESFKSVRRAILKFESTAINLDELIAVERHRISSIMNKVDNIAGTISNNSPKINDIIGNMQKLSTTVANADLTGMINKAQETMNQISQITTKINNGEGTMGALIKSDSLYNELNQTNEQIQRLVENLKENPHRYVHFSIFGRREKGMKLDPKEEKRLKQILNEPPKNGNQ
ncbi:MAG TPA: MlaD family protein, partial [Flavobacteriales bacterium]|nr:MlaD family protein [Flavobacteriales bacterium]